VATACRERGASVSAQRLDVRDTAALRDWVAALESGGPIDLALVNAGMTANVRETPDGESWATVERVLDVNLKGALATVDALLPGMRRRRAGQIALVSSISAWFGLPLTPSYCAAKAGLKAYGEALRGWLGPQGVGVTVILPGFVASAMSERFPGPRAFLVSPERAAAVIAGRLRHDPPRISFPLPLSLGMRGLAMLPAAWSLRILRHLGYGG
jgi:NAD(P)-dependent dehydrogenase (short-subunit alcohol dehydrogenase family)